MPEIYHCNPKSITMGQLYGCFDPNTNEWQDGILAGLVRICIKTSAVNDNLKWLLLDGPVDAIWIENMNTVLDDNKKLCLTSGEIMALTPSITMMFEAEDLAVASPATVSRCGMIYMEPKSLGFEPLKVSWLEGLAPCFTAEMKATLHNLFETYIAGALSLLRRNLVEPLPTVDNCLVEGLMHILDVFFDLYRVKDGDEPKTPAEITLLAENIEPLFIFALVWSICITSNTQGRLFWNEFLRTELEHNGSLHAPPKEGLIYDYCYDLFQEGGAGWRHWIDTVPPYVYDPKLGYSELIIPTKDSISYNYFLVKLVGNGSHVLMTGPTGTGKSVNISDMLQSGFSDKFVPIIVNFSAQTGANQTQDLIDSKCEKRRKGVFGPSAGKRFILFVDDVNMPQKEEYGAQPPIEILRQWFDSDGWYVGKGGGGVRHPPLRPSRLSATQR